MRSLAELGRGVGHVAEQRPDNQCPYNIFTSVPLRAYMYKDKECKNLMPEPHLIPYRR